MRRIVVLTVLEPLLKLDALYAAISAVMSATMPISIDTLPFVSHAKDVLVGTLAVVVVLKNVLEEVQKVLIVAKEIVISIGELVAAARGLFQAWAQWPNSIRY
ncbi:uncharacterized protein N7518_007436 [Penicillium psychrosexuale]|uniref:uncharacterized protein n=1 Tax=Penicillium psychrosexuale TaxID=1002107 RepID=UPI0025456FDE|nr:uncharacterized protein N7518_007436 [Penicillium psychrosexuale]KAJ5790425.1 hypothetical protein N7518_007436 [Penicillium psychrosexuale]